MASTPCSSIHSSTAAGIRCELKLEQLPPHFLLRAAKKGNVLGVRARAGEKRDALAQQLVLGGDHMASLAQVIAEVYDSVAKFEPRQQRFVQGLQPPGLTMHGTHRPDPLRASQHRKAAVGFFRHARSRVRAGLRGRQAARSIFSRRSVAACSSIFSTAANSRASRSSAAS